MSACLYMHLAGLTPGQVTRSSSDTVDVVFLLDHTGTVNETEFDYQKNFVNAFVDAVPFGRNDYRIAVLSWNSAGNEHVLLNELFNATLFKEQVEMIAYAPVGIPDLALGLQRMKEVFRTGYGARSYATHVGIVLIDGPANPGYQVAAGLLEDEDVLLIGVALDSHATATAVLNEIISNPDRILGEEFALLDTRVSDIIALIRECSESGGSHSCLQFVYWHKHYITVYNTYLYTIHSICTIHYTVHTYCKKCNNPAYSLRQNFTVLANVALSGNPPFISSTGCSRTQQYIPSCLPQYT